ncbi:DUF4296 domain-containing protein [Hymenobacter wooponensis]|uniref:DUF4296 domain-containing protein n=1 Tax=Hymenobacter wooponensis TaxID=1525360 RepID=A0A4Z0MJL6_9BACT|nr:DUF4296 domain-containing protein [Hymenobacter wooponensis]TGD79744.1 DUF4296 domain-containing protein [Hymenobacter wooponensis]
MKNTFLCLLLVLCSFLTACQKPEDVAPPSKLLPQEKMVSLLVNIHILEAQVDASALPSDSARALFLQQKKDLFKRFDVTDSTFQQSYRYYAVHDKDLDDIYKTVIDSLGKREEKFGVKPELP